MFIIKMSIDFFRSFSRSVLYVLSIGRVFVCFLLFDASAFLCVYFFYCDIATKLDVALYECVYVVQ